VSVLATLKDAKVFALSATLDDLAILARVFKRKEFTLGGVDDVLQEFLIHGILLFDCYVDKYAED